MGRIQADYQHIRSALNDVRTKATVSLRPHPVTCSSQSRRSCARAADTASGSKPAQRPSICSRRISRRRSRPEIGGENASSEILGFLLQGFDGDVEQLWQSNIFGKPIYTIAQEGVEEKLSCLPTKAVGKLQETLQRVVNEGSGTLICIIL